MYILTQVKVEKGMLRAAIDPKDTIAAQVAKGILARAPKLTIGPSDACNLTSNVRHALAAFGAQFLGFVDLSLIDIGTDYIGVVCETEHGVKHLENQTSYVLSDLEKALRDGQYATESLRLDICTGSLTPVQLQSFMDLAALYTKRDSPSRRLYFKNEQPQIKEKTQVKEQGGKIQVVGDAMGMSVVKGVLTFTKNHSAELEERLESITGAGYCVVPENGCEFGWTRLEIVMPCTTQYDTPGFLPFTRKKWHVDATLKIGISVIDHSYSLQDFRVQGTKKRL